MPQIGITERGDAALDTPWLEWVIDNKPTILITKNPGSLLKTLQRWDLTGAKNIIIHCTITGLGGSELEPNVPIAETSIDAYKHLIAYYGTEAVVLRIDPIFLYPMTLFDRARDVLGKRVEGGRVRISFADMYSHVAARIHDRRLEDKYSGIVTSYCSRLHYDLKLRKAALHFFPNTEICGEPDIACYGCVSQRDLTYFGLTAPNYKGGQRQACACINAKHELLTNKMQCAHKCTYCYWR